MDAKKNRTSLMLGVVGLLLQLASIFTVPVFEQGSSVPSIILFSGIALLIVGLAYYAMAKGQSPLWDLLGLLSIIGLIFLVCLPDRVNNRR